jgi:Domain of unknown function (DUF2019)
MKRVTFNKISVAQLVDRFIAIALDQHEAMLDFDSAKFNRLYDERKNVEEELKRRPGDQRRVLLPLLNHPNAQVRLISAIATLALAPEAAQQTLQVISDREEYPQAVNARGMLRALREGAYIPN